MPIIRLLLLALTLLAMASPADADGTVFRAEGCGQYIFVSTTNGFSVLRVDSTGTGVKDGNQLRGEVERIGRTTLFDQTLGRAVFGDVTERNLTRSELNQRIALHCRSPLGDRTTFAYVFRAGDCGNRIFVSTPQGFAVVERISGGVVANGDTLVGSFNRPGRVTLQNREAGSNLVVFIEDLWLSRSAVERKIQTSCGRRR